jgi:DNA polymerase-3 subunit alpha
MQDDCINLIAKKHGKDRKELWKSIQPEYIDFNDLNVYKTVFWNRKHMTAIFQFTEDYARKFCEKVKPTSVEEIGAITSICRPGPLAADVDKLYIQTKKNPESIKYEHPVLEEILGSTYGFMIFQEQMMQVGHRLGKLNLAETDKLRKVIVKKDKTTIGKANDDVDVLYNKFKAGCAENGLTSEQADGLWDKMKAFQGYGFNKSHAISYAVVSYQCAWLRTYYPLEWLAAVLNSNDSPKILAEVRSQGYKILQPDINISNRDWTIDYDKQAIRVGLKSIKGLGDAAVEEIVLTRPYESIKDLMVRCSINKKCVDALVRC